MLSVKDIIENEFFESAEDRGDDPDAALERLMLEYIRQDQTIAELFASADDPAISIKEYNPDDDRPLGYQAANALPSYAGTLKIDPDDVTDEKLPQYREVRRNVILCVLRYQHERNCDDARHHDSVIRRDDVARAAEAVLGNIAKDDEYKRDEYIKRVMTELLVRNPGDERMGFFSANDAQVYLESLEPANHQDERDVYHVSRHLFEQYEDEIDMETVNAVRDRFCFKPLG